MQIAPRQAGGGKPPRSYFQVRAENGAQWDIPNNDMQTVKHALLERVYFVKKDGQFQRPPRPWTTEAALQLPEDTRMDYAREVLDQRMAGFSDTLKSVSMQRERSSPLSVREFVDGYGGQKRKVYEAAAESLKDKPFNNRDAEVKVFTKDEYLKPGGAPRAIQPRSPRFNVMLGRYLKPIEHEVFDAINKVFDASGEHRTVAKGMNMIERGQVIAGMWNNFNDPVAIGLDASRFDQHIHELLLEFEHKHYEYFVEATGDGLPPLKHLLALTRSNKGSYKGKDGRLKYAVRGNRMSGDMNTSLGNILIMCALMHSYLRAKGLLTKARLLNDGDDCVLIMDRRNVSVFREGLEKWFEEMGITMCYDGVYTSLEEVEFCQAHPVRNVEGGWMLVPRPTKRLYSDLVSTKPINSKKVYRKWLGAVAGCGAAASRGVPVFGSFYRWLGTGATPYIPQDGDMYRDFRMSLIDGMNMRYREPSLEERISFYFAFNITPNEQVMMEKYYDNLPSPVWTKPEDDVPRTMAPIQWLIPPEQKEDHKRF